jgi:hypothetical protein
MITIAQFVQVKELAATMQGMRDREHADDSFATPTFTFANEVFAHEFAGYVPAQLDATLTTTWDGYRTVTVRA